MATQLRAENAVRLGRKITDLLSSGPKPANYLAGLLNSVPALISAVDENGLVLFASPEHLELKDVAESLDDVHFVHHLFPAFVSKRFKPSLVKAVLEGGLEHWEMSAYNKQGRPVLYSISHKVVRDEHSGQQLIFTVGVQSKAADLATATVLKEQQDKLSYLSYHDELTGLANRSLFYDRVHKSLIRAKQTNGNFALLLFDLDRFRNINDSLSHEAGDQLLKAVARRLQEELRDTDTVARLGADEFVVILENIERPRDIENIADKLSRRVSEPVELEGHELRCTASIGISLYPKDGDSIDQLLKYADLAMNRAKLKGKNRTQFYVKAMADNAVNYLLLENDLRRAINDEELCLQYQPQIDLSSGRICGLEALVRWQHKKRGMVSPGEFIPLAEETGLIEPLGAWVLYRACSQFQSWLMQGINFGKVAVNLSPLQFRQDHIEQHIVKTLLETRLSPEYLELELTESCAMENAAETIQVLNCLAEMGLGLAIDDFGTGYSSLAYLKRFPINKLKIDRSFVKDIDVNESDASIAKSVIDLAHNMNLRVVAEGVERASQCQWLSEWGCDQVQGFYFAKPMNQEALLALTNDTQKCEKNEAGVRLLLP
ncbi:putative bifunctional diguanylate cyclase/phosphodiesterase [Agaribacterium haliotis]|uniref:putative bifunctional diguanylate cyclase/phosphodiesterase n=1 Tax=Agaribacterium haliotis TaxID=2013869 RepID=UPI000BB5343A|nr:EAL domain-containing protein [Agaribacterium haliotis]